MGFSFGASLVDQPGTGATGAAVNITTGALASATAARAVNMNNNALAFDNVPDFRISPLPQDDAQVRLVTVDPTTGQLRFRDVASLPTGPATDTTITTGVLQPASALRNVPMNNQVLQFSGAQSFDVLGAGSIGMTSTTTANIGAQNAISLSSAAGDVQIPGLTQSPALTQVVVRDGANNGRLHWRDAATLGGADTTITTGTLLAAQTDRTVDAGTNVINFTNGSVAVRDPGNAGAVSLRLGARASDTGFFTNAAGTEVHLAVGATDVLAALQNGDVRAPAYPNTRDDAAAAVNFLSTLPDGTLQSNPISELAVGGANITVGNLQPAAAGANRIMDFSGGTVSFGNLSQASYTGRQVHQSAIWDEINTAALVGHERVIIDTATGELKRWNPPAAAPPTDTNITTGTLAQATADRTVDMGGNSLTVFNTSGVTLTSANLIDFTTPVIRLNTAPLQDNTQTNVLARVGTSGQLRLVDISPFVRGNLTTGTLAPAAAARNVNMNNNALTFVDAGNFAINQTQMGLGFQYSNPITSLNITTATVDLNGPNGQTLSIQGNGVNISGNMSVGGKLTVAGGIDPPQYLELAQLAAAPAAQPTDPNGPTDVANTLWLDNTGTLRKGNAPLMGNFATADLVFAGGRTHDLGVNFLNIRTALAGGRNANWFIQGSSTQWTANDGAGNSCSLVVEANPDVPRRAIRMVFNGQTSLHVGTSGSETAGTVQQCLTSRGENTGPVWGTGPVENGAVEGAAVGGHLIGVNSAINKVYIPNDDGFWQEPNPKPSFPQIGLWRPGPSQTFTSVGHRVQWLAHDTPNVGSVVSNFAALPEGTWIVDCAITVNQITNSIVSHRIETSVNNGASWQLPSASQVIQAPTSNTTTDFVPAMLAVARVVVAPGQTMLVTTHIYSITGADQSGGVDGTRCFLKATRVA